MADENEIRPISPASPSSDPGALGATAGADDAQSVASHTDDTAKNSDFVRTQAEAELNAANAMLKRVDALIAEAKSRGADADDIANLENIRSGMASNISSATAALNSGKPSLATAIISTTSLGTALGFAQAEAQEAITEERIEEATEDAMLTSEQDYYDNYSHTKDLDPFDTSGYDSFEWDRSAESSLKNLGTVKENELAQMFEELGISDADLKQAYAQRSLTASVLQKDVAESAVSRMEGLEAAASAKLSPDEMKLLAERKAELGKLEFLVENGNAGQFSSESYDKAFAAYKAKHPELAGYVDNVDKQHGRLEALQFQLDKPMDPKEAQTLLPEREALMAKANLGPLAPEDAQKLEKIVKYDLHMEYMKELKTANAPHVKKMQEAVNRELTVIEAELHKPEGQRDLKGALDKARDARYSAVKPSEEALEQMSEAKEKAGAAKTGEVASTVTPEVAAQTPAPQGIMNASAKAPESAVQNPLGTALAGYKPVEGITYSPTSEVAAVVDKPKAEEVKLAGVTGGETASHNDNKVAAAVPNLAEKEISRVLTA
jgi:hypothetical protein